MSTNGFETNGFELNEREQLENVNAVREAFDAAKTLMRKHEVPGISVVAMYAPAPDMLVMEDSTSNPVYFAQLGHSFTGQTWVVQFRCYLVALESLVAALYDQVSKHMLKLSPEEQGSFERFIVEELSETCICSGDLIRKAIGMRSEREMLSRLAAEQADDED